MKKSNLRTLALWSAALAIGLLLLGSLVYFAAPLILAGEAQSDTPVEGQASEAGAASSPDEPLKVMTLNIAHARNDAPNQLLLSRERFEANLDAIAAVLIREMPHVVALQEADGPSLWSGNFDHVAWLAEGADFAQWVRGRHVDGLGLRYGTAVLSQLPISGASYTTFEPEPPFGTRGLVQTTIESQQCGGTAIDVVSLHLDPLRNSVRQRQVAMAIAALEDSDRPLIVMGDFNDEWLGADSKVRALAKGLALQAYMPGSEGLKTFPLFDFRLDWILLSEDLEFVSYEVINDEISDHRPVVAEITMICD